MSKPQILLVNSGYAPDPEAVAVLSGAGYAVSEIRRARDVGSSITVPGAASLVVEFLRADDADWTLLNALHSSDDPLPLIVVLDTDHSSARNGALRRGAARVLVAGECRPADLLAAVTEVLSHADTIRMQNQWLHLQGVMLDAIDVYILLLDDSGRISYRNDRFIRHLHALGLPRDCRAINSLYTDVVGQLNQMSELRRSKLLQGIREVQARTRNKFHFIYRALVETRQHWLQFQVQLVDDMRFRGVLITGVDITEQMAMRAARRKDSELLRNILDSIDEGILVVDMAGNVILHNDNACRIMGIPARQLERLHHDIELRRAADNSILPQDELPLVRARRNETVHNEQLLINIGGGERRLLNVSAMPLREAGGTTYGGILSLHDVTEGDRLEAERSRLAHALEQSVDIVIITDASGLIRYVNRAFEHVYGKLRATVVGSPADFIGQTVADNGSFMPPWNPAARGEQWSGRLASESTFRSRILLDTRISPLHDRYGAADRYVIVQRDVTAQAELEERMRQAQRIESIGKLAGGVAHDFNNLLTVIRGHTESLLGALAGQSEWQAEVQAINQAVDSAARLTSELLSFGRRQALLPGVVSINEIISSKQQMIRSLLGEGISLEIVLDQRPCYVNIDRHRVEQIIINLVVNARDAMPDGGQVHISTFTCVMNDVSAVPLGLRPGAYVGLEIRDTGCGMEPTVLAHIFEPFFTTKSGSKGSGLGLSSAYGIVSQSGGTIAVDSMPGQGSRFTVYLVPAEELGKAGAVDSEQPKARASAARVLLVEDSEEIRRLSARALQRQGYHVDAFASGEEALKVVRQSSEHYDMLLTDVVLPGMSGPALAGELEQSRPAMPVVFMSGYAHDHIDALRSRKSGQVFLQKPFTMADLSRLVSCVLEGQPLETDPAGCWQQPEFQPGD